jgi:hypothetical protein
MLAGVAAAVLGLLAVVATGPFDGDGATARDVATPFNPASARLGDAELTEMFDAMSSAVAQQSPAGFISAAGSTPWARRTWRNLDALGVDKVDLTHVPDAAARSRAAGVSVEVTWTPGADSTYAGETTVPRLVSFTVGVTGAGDAAVLGAGRVGDTLLPVWLMGDLDVSAVRDATVISTNRQGPQADVEALTRRALAAVRRVLDGSEADAGRPVVVVAPATAEQGASVGGSALDDAAAVTTTVDGSRRLRAPVQVVLNPAEFDRLRPRGAQVVVTHEVTHAVTGVAASAMPLWVAEGFADWVALRDVRVPLDVAAGRLLAAVRRAGRPAELPTDADFAKPQSAAPAYEAAWTLFRHLGRRGGERAVVGFYADVLAGQPVEAALKGNAGLDVSELTRSWRTGLERLARG